MKVKEKELALKLRIEQQLSLKQISDITGLSKSTLSVTLRDYPLSKKRIKELSIGAQLKGSMVNKSNSENRKLKYQEDGVSMFNNHQGFRDLVFLYWGEGSKYKGNSIFSLSNTDANMIQYVVNVLKDIGYGDKIVATSYCYEHSNLDDIKKFWYEYIGKEIRTYVVKNSKSSKHKRIDKQPYGTLRCDVYSIELLYNVLGAIDHIKGSLAQR